VLFVTKGFEGEIIQLKIGLIDHFDNELFNHKELK